MRKIEAPETDQSPVMDKYQSLPPPSRMTSKDFSLLSKISDGAALIRNSKMLMTPNCSFPESCTSEAGEIPQWPVTLNPIYSGPFRSPLLRSQSGSLHSKNQPAFSDLQICFLFVPRIRFPSWGKCHMQNALDTRQLEKTESESRHCGHASLSRHCPGCPQSKRKALPPTPTPELSERSFQEGEGEDALAEASHAQLCVAELASEQLSHVCPRRGPDVGTPLWITPRGTAERDPGAGGQRKTEANSVLK